MTLRKQLIRMMLIIIFIAIFLNSFISSSFIDNYFKGYVSEQYDENINKIIELAKYMNSEAGVDITQSVRELQNYIKDPIVGITIYDEVGSTLVMVENEMFNMHNNMMMGRQYVVEEDQFELKDRFKNLGRVSVFRNSSVTNSDTVRLFKKSLLWGAFVSAVFVVFITIGLILIISKRIVRDLVRAADHAKAIELGNDIEYDISNIVEIKTLQLTLYNLSSKLRIQKSSRREKVDQLTHETRTPLTILKSHCEGALDGIVEMDKERLNRCIKQIDHLSNMLENIEEVIDYNDGDERSLVITKIDAIKNISKIMSGLQLQYDTKGITLLYDGPVTMTVHLDEVMLDQILYNILTNAYKFSEKGGIVTINVTPLEEEKFKIAISDTGIGIRPEDVATVFDAYFRSHNALSEQGDGLGLYITKEHISKMGGTVTIESTLGVGTVLNIVLPIKMI